jgi:hypothetical protein
VVKRADKRCPKGNRMKKDNFQFINQIGFCENDRSAELLTLLPASTSWHSRLSRSAATLTDASTFG